MYIVFGAIILLLIAYFWQTLYQIVNSLINNSNNLFLTGNIWFVALLIMNVVLITFIIGFYYYKSTLPGPEGPTGDKGFQGRPGKACEIKDGCRPGF